MVRFYTFITILVILIIFLYAKTGNRNLLSILFIIIGSILFLFEVKKLRCENSESEDDD